MEIANAFRRPTIGIMSGAITVRSRKNITFTINGIEVFGWGAVEYHNVTGRPLVRLDMSYAMSIANGNAAPRLNGPCYLTARLNSPLTWTISAMEKSPLGSTCSPTPTIVDMGDIEIIEVFEHA